MKQKQRAQLTLAALLIGIAAVNSGQPEPTAVILVILGCANLWMGLGAFIKCDESSTEGRQGDSQAAE